MESYRDLVVWQKSTVLTLEVYKLTNSFPKEEMYGLISQMRRAAVSIPSNIAEGYSRKHRAEYLQFIRIAFGSGAELETQALVARKLSYATESDFNFLEAKLSEVMKMLNGLVSSLS